MTLPCCPRRSSDATPRSSSTRIATSDSSKLSRARARKTGSTRYGSKCPNASFAGFEDCLRARRCLLVLPDADCERIGGAVVDYLRGEIGNQVTLEPKSIGEIPDLAELAVTEKYRLLIVSGHLWEGLPEKARRLASVIPTVTQIDMESLETVRVQAGVLL